MPSEMRLVASPPEALFDETIRITASGLPPRSRVRITNEVELKGAGLFVSSADFESDSEGRVEVNSAAALSGSSYAGVLPMGLFDALGPGPGLRKGSHARPSSAQTPWHHTLTLRCLATGREVSTAVTRTFLHPGVRREEVAVGRLRGALFVHRDGVPRPGVLDIFGGGGGLTEYRAALLAAKGFTTFALPFYRYKDLPKAFGSKDQPIELDYFKEAADYLTSRPDVRGHKIGVVGLSTGGFLSFLLACHSDRVAAAVSISGPDRIATSINVTVGGKPFASSPSPVTVMETEDGMWRTLAYQESLEGGDEVKLLHSAEGTKFLHAVGSDDIMEMAVKAQGLYREEMRRGGRLEDWEEVCYEGAGHLLEPPHQRFCRFSYHQDFKVLFLWGGRLEEHARAQVALWERLQRFLAVNVSEPVAPSAQAPSKL